MPSPHAPRTHIKPLDRLPTILVLGAGPAQLGLLEAARARGLHVVAADRDPEASGFRPISSSVMRCGTVIPCEASMRFETLCSW